MVGFALIVIVVTVIALFLLSLYIKKPGKIYNDNEIASFLHASMLVTTECSPARRPGTIYNTKDLIKSCGKASGEKCTNNKDTCTTLTESLTALLDQSFVITPDSKYSAYSLKITNKLISNTPVIQPINSPTGTLGVGDKYTAGIMIPDGGYVVNLTFYSRT